MASLSLSSLPLQPPPSQSRTSPLNNNNSGVATLKPIVISGNPPTSVSAPGRRIVAVGDLHGDLSKARGALELAGVLSSDGRYVWTGQATVLIQLGDILDRGEDEIAILSLLRSLEIQAREHGGAVFQVNGNHETMNVEGDFRYVDSGAFDECSDFVEYLDDCGHNWEEAFISWTAVSEKWKEERRMSLSYWGPWNLVKVDDWVFCHGGLLPHHVTYGIEKMNKEVSSWMGSVCEDEGDMHMPFIATRGYDSVVWNRLYSRDNPALEDYQINQIQSVLDSTLQVLGAKAMVVGHTPQTTGVNCKYNCSIWRIDVGMSSGVLDSRPEVLEIKGDTARVIRNKSDSFNELQAIDYT